MKKGKIVILTIAGIVVVLGAGAGVAYSNLANQTGPTVSTKKSDSDQSTGSKKVLATKSFTKDEVNDMIQSELQNSHYQVNLDGQNIVATSTSSSLKGQLTMTPKVTSDGNVVLTVKKAKVNSLDVPAKAALGYLLKQNVAPAGVAIQPSQGQITLDLSQLTQDGQTAYQAKQIDVQNGIFKFAEVDTSAQ
ncbi:DUF2140 family protein [Fructobacillus tropaeoli]|uniref:DUF2140 family protein n=1 Tax=Fructobacillus tropaeoli TaxID=709323 RepID=UPI002D849C18|nr:DUF2140 family (YpmS) [Fructobacillus tropaeoli]